LKGLCISRMGVSVARWDLGRSLFEFDSEGLCLPKSLFPSVAILDKVCAMVALPKAFPWERGAGRGHNS
jgi:hypothetical protein